jgi:hypothetical protein
MNLEWFSRTQKNAEAIRGTSIPEAAEVIDVLVGDVRVAPCTASLFDKAQEGVDFPVRPLVIRRLRRHNGNSALGIEEVNRVFNVKVEGRPKYWQIYKMKSHGNNSNERK